MNVILGSIKGLIVGGGVGYAALRFGWTQLTLTYFACAAVGALVGVVAGRSPWRSETIWTPIVKLVVGALVGTGLCLVAYRFLPDRSFTLPKLGALHVHSAAVLSPLVGILYGILVEVDDAGGRGGPPKTRR